MNKKVLIISSSPRITGNSARLAGFLFCGGVTDVGDIENSSKLNEAYEMGKGI